MADLTHGRGWLSDTAAASLHRVDAEIGHPLQITEAGRSMALQRRYWDEYQRYLAGGPWAPIAAYPDESAPHIRGIAIDTDERITDVLNRHGWYHTVYRNGVLVEAWHYEHDPARDQHAAAPNFSLEDDMIRIQSPGRGIALIGPGYYRHLSSDEEVENSGPLIAAHHSGNDRQFDLWVSMAVEGVSAGVSSLRASIATEGRPLKLYSTPRGLTLIGPGGRSWILPSDDYRPLLDALGLAPLHPIRYLPDNEFEFVQFILSELAPDPRAAAQVEAILALSEEDAARIAAQITAETPGAVADELARRLRD